MNTCAGRSSFSRLLLLAVAPLALLAGGAAAQTPTGFSPLSVFQMAERQDWVLRASMSDGGSIVGRVRAIDDASARLDGGRVAFAQLELLERGERHAAGARKGALIGGAVVGGIVAIVLGIEYLSGSTRDDFVLPVALGTGIGAVAGGLLGAVLDPAETRWRPIWPSGSTGTRE